jgi:hypothetical protein
MRLTDVFNCDMAGGSNDGGNEYFAKNSNRVFAGLYKLGKGRPVGVLFTIVLDIELKTPLRSSHLKLTLSSPKHTEPCGVSKSQSSRQSSLRDSL